MFGIKAKDIALASGVGENQISRFRTGKTDLYAGTLFALLNALSCEARAYFLALVVTDDKTDAGIGDVIESQRRVKVET